MNNPFSAQEDPQWPAKKEFDELYEESFDDTSRVSDDEVDEEKEGGGKKSEPSAGLVAEGKKDEESSDDEEEEETIEPRLISVNKPDINFLQKFADNYVSTTKYKFWNFLPKNLFEQFRRVANIYFLVIALITLTPISPVKPGAFLLALVVVLGATAIKEGLEDWRRYQSDKQINNRPCSVLRAQTSENYAKKHGGGSGKWERMTWKDIRVGDVVRVRNWEPFPADLLLLSSSNPTGQCYIETSNLDGETNLKIRQALKETMGIQSQADLLALAGAVACDQPNPDMYKFDGSLAMSSGGVSNEVPLGLNQLLLRGSILRNTNYILGLALYTGHETKYMLSTTDPPSKRSRVERMMNRLIIMVLVGEIILVLASAILGGIWQELQGLDMWYLDISDHVLVTSILGFFTFLVLYSPMVPISLYVTMEFVRVGQAFFIERDAEMYYDETNTWANARTSNLNEELGQIDYVFSDKTGTLTCNQMIFRVCSVGGHIFGRIPDLSKKQVTNSGAGELAVAPNYTHMTSLKLRSATNAIYRKREKGKEKESATEKEKEQENEVADLGIEGLSEVPVSLEPKGQTLPKPSNGGQYEIQEEDIVVSKSRRGKKQQSQQVIQPMPAWTPPVKEVDFEDDTLFDCLENEDDKRHSYLMEFLSVLAVCHTVIPEEALDVADSSTESDAEDVPDILKRKIRYQASSPDESALVAAAKHFGFFFHGRDQNSVIVNVMGQDEKFEILNVLEFTSTRKRMSVVVRTPNGQIKLYCKGADSVIFERLHPQHQQFASATAEHLHRFACAGLRTLCVARAILDPVAYANWNARWKKAEVSMTNRKAKLAELAEELEVNLELIGATGIEDRLQDGVPETIELLLVAGVKIWVLTGDKRETAVNVGKACNLLKDGMIVLQLLTDTKSTTKQQIETFLQLIRSRKYEELEKYNALRELVGQNVNNQGGEVPIDLDLGLGNKSKVPEFALVVEGRTLTFALEDDVKLELLKLANYCHTVISCRATPLQKTLVVRLVRDFEHLTGTKHKTRDFFVRKKVTTLSIGDGANDVPMIQEAHVGVGISGKEGMQAVLASDYSIAQFRFLAQLMLVHGRYSYKRVSLLVLYFFYKNLLIAMINLWWSFFTGFSGQTIWDAYLGIGFNLLFTALPIIVVACMDQDVPQDALMRYPQLYRDGLKHISLNTPAFIRWVTAAVLGSLATFAIPAIVFNGPVFASGQVDGLWDVNTVIYASTVLVCNLKLALETSTWTWLQHSTMWGSIASFFVFAMIYMSDLFFWLAPNQYYIIYRLMGNPVFWFTLLITCIVCLLPDLTWKYAIRNYAPENHHIVQEIMHKEKRRADKKNPPSWTSYFY